MIGWFDRAHRHITLVQNVIVKCEGLSILVNICGGVRWLILLTHSNLGTAGYVLVIESKILIAGWVDILII